LERKIPVIFSAHRSDDLMTALRLAEEFQLKPMLSLATEGYLNRRRDQESKAPVIVHPTMQRASTLETFNGHLGNAAFLADQSPISSGAPLLRCWNFAQKAGSRIRPVEC